MGLVIHAPAAGPLQRVHNTTLSAMPQFLPTVGYTWTNALGSMNFNNPVCIASPPGETNRLFILEKAGVVVVITNLASPNRTVFLDITPQVISADWTDERGLLGLEFHPGYATNGYFFIWFTGTTNTINNGVTNTGMHDMLWRYHVSANNPNAADPSSGTCFIAQYDRAINHNAGDLHFGLDNYLYISLGDEGGADGVISNTPTLNPQRIDGNFFSGLIRIDVDKRATNLVPNPHGALLGQTNYFVPADNPFVGATTFNGLTLTNTNAVRTEFWAVGLRNPWRYTIDTDGTIIEGDVGQAQREEVNLITKGGNYGWNYWEGTIQRSNTPPGFVMTPPLYEYQHFSAYNAIIGGRVSRGARLSQLYGAYVFADTDAGRVWDLRYTGTNVTETNLLFTSDLNSSGDAAISTFGVDPSNGDLLYASEGTGANGTVRRIIYNNTTNGAPVPPLLSGTGAFTNLNTLAVAPGVIPYDINVPFWSDNAIKSRWISVPDTNLTISFSPTNNWTFPTGTVWIKHFDLVTNTVPQMTTRLETRLLIKNSNGVYGVTYRWGGSTNDATIVPDGGTNETFVINEAGILRTQVWHYPSRLECQQCHTLAGGFGLGFTAAQLNKDFNYNGTVTNEIIALSQAGYLNTNLTDVSSLMALAPATNTATNVEYRARSFLAANCSQCHQPGGLAHANWDARITTPTAQANIINGPLNNNLGNPNAVVIAPASPSNSMLLTRISTRGTIQMPPLDTTVVDTQAVALITQWINSLGNGYSLSATPGSQSVTQGLSTSFTVSNIISGTFTDPVTFAVSGLPSGAGAGFVPTSLTGSGSSTLTVTTATNTPAGTYPLTIYGIDGTTTNTTSVTLVVNFSGPPFKLTAGPVSQTTTQGQSAIFLVTNSILAGFTNSVTLSATGLPSGATAGFVPASITGAGSSTMTVTTAFTTPTGSFPFTITGIGGGVTNSTNVTLVINHSGPPFTLTSTTSQTTTQGQSAIFLVTNSVLAGFTNSVSFSVSGLPSGANAGFVPNSISGSGVSTQTVTTAFTTPTGTNQLTITGIGGGFTNSTNVTLIIKPSGPPFTLTAGPSSQTTTQALNAIFTLTNSVLAGFTNAVTLSASGLPAGANAGFVPGSLTGTGSSTMTVTTTTNTPAGSYPVTITGTGGGFTNSTNVTLVISFAGPPFSLTAGPSSQTVTAGVTAVYFVTNSVLAGFTNRVTLSASGLPTGANAGFVPNSITGAASSTLTITTAFSTPAGTNLVTITGTGGSFTNSASVSLVILPPGPPMMVWNATNGVSANTNWSTALNWTNLPAGGLGPPGATNDVLFANVGTTGAVSNINNVVNASLAVDSLWYANTNGYHSTLIASGQTLTITGFVPGVSNSPVLQVGDEQSATAANPQPIYTTITGSGGKLVLSNTLTRLQIREGGASSPGTPVTNLATLDLSGLGNLIADIDGISLGIENTTPRHTAGVLYLARTNLLTLTHDFTSVTPWFTAGNPGLLIGHNTQAGESVGSAIYLGQSNAIYADYVVVGQGSQSNAPCFLAFNPVFTNNNPTAYFRAADTTNWVGLWIVGDDSAGDAGAGPSPATNDFSCGTIDLAVTNLFVGRGQDGNQAGAVGAGTLSFSSGTIRALDLRVGAQIDDVAGGATNSSGVGTVNVTSASAKLIVDATLELAHLNGGSTLQANTNTAGTLNLKNGVVTANTISAGGGKSALTANGGTLTITNRMGAPGQAISTLNLTNVSLHLRVNGSAIVTNVVASNLTASGVSTIFIDSITNLSTNATFPLIAYTSFSGTVAANFALAPLPGYTSSLIDNAANKTIDLKLISSASAAPRFTGIKLTTGGLAVNGTNGAPGGNYYILASTNITLPLTNWTVLSTNSFDAGGNFNSTNALPTNAQQFYLLRLP